MVLKDVIDLGIAIATGLLALATYRLARHTKTMATETQEGLKQAESHHRENLRPYCVIEFENVTSLAPYGPEFLPRQGRRIPTRDGGEWAPGETPKKHISIKGTLRNKGLGPAVGVSVYLNRRAGGDQSPGERSTYPVKVADLLAVGDAIDIDVPIDADSDIRLAAELADRRQIPDREVHDRLTQTAHGTAEIVLEYQDIFGNYFRAAHPRGGWRGTPEERSEMSATDAGREEAIMRPNRRSVSFHEGRQPAAPTTLDTDDSPVNGGGHRQARGTD